MNDRIRTIDDQSVHVTHAPLITRYDRVKRIAMTVLVIVGIACAAAGLVFGVAPDVRSQVNPAPPVCEMQNNTMGFCP